MNLSSPWTPTLNGIILPSLGRYQVVVDEDAKPYSRTAPGWDEKSIKTLIANIPQAGDALWETVLALWRLKLVEPSEDEMEEDELWRNWVMAWLVSFAISLSWLY